MDKVFFQSLKKHPRQILLDKELKFVFFSQNKVAQTSINRTLLKSRVVVPKDGYLRWRYYHFKICNNWNRNRPFTFTIVREPVDRFKSAFRYLQNIGKISVNENINSFIKYRLYDSETNSWFDPHFIPQYDIRFSPELNLDFVGKFENLNDDWRKIALEIGANTKLPHSNKTEGTKKQLDLTEYSLTRLNNLYATDFEKFNY